MPTEPSASASPPTARPSPGRSAKPQKPHLSERIAAGGLISLAFVAVVAFGASEVMSASLFAGLYAAALAVLLLGCDWARRDLTRLTGLKIQGVLFAVLMAAVLWPLTPWSPDGAHPVWAYLPGAVGSVAIDRSALLLNALQLLGLACLFLAGRVIGASEARARWALWALIIAVGLYAMFGFVDHVTTRRGQRLVATLLSPNSAATLFGAGLVMTAAAAANRLRQSRGLRLLRRGDPTAMLAIGVAAMLATALLLTGSRGGVLATGIGLGAFLLWEAVAQRHRLRAALILGGVALILVLGAIFLRSGEVVTERFGQVDQDFNGRGQIFAAHWIAFKAAPWFGYGLGSFPTVDQVIITVETLPVLFNVRAAHNLYLQWLEEAGVVGTAAMFGLTGWLLALLARAGLKTGSVAAWSRATVCAALVFLIHGLTDFALQAPAITALAALTLGIVVSAVSEKRAGRRAYPVAPVRAATASAVAVAIVALLVVAPMLAARLGGDLSSWPTASAEVLAFRIERALARPDAAGLVRAQRLSDRELHMRPASGAAWLRRAALAAAQNRDGEMGAALERSFDVAPLQTSLFRGRTIFAYNHWTQISQAAREQTIAQLRAEWARGWGERPFIALANEITDETGRTGLALQIVSLRIEQPKPDTRR
ncbi:MAG: hypothetical protein JWP92_3174 [Caulobacter sp.]|nr:hypothetical protein [Caulobacter sp.]